MDQQARVEGAWDSLPGSETAVDYDARSTEVSEQPHLEQHFGIPVPQYFSTPLPAVRDLTIEVVVTTPDGRRFVTSESQEYELDDNGDVKNYDFEDVYSVVERVMQAATQSLP